MAYKPKEWVCGDTITADDLNHMENGIADAGGGGVEVVTFTSDGSNWTPDRSYEEIKQLLVDGTPCVALIINGAASREYLLLSQDSSHIENIMGAFYSTVNKDVWQSKLMWHPVMGVDYSNSKIGSLN